MADIPLRTYVEQLDNLVSKQPDEAIAHCRHILGLYPKHVDTYRLLGKALLEKKRHGDAADIFQRVLSVLPDDFISHVGMAIVREDEANLDAAVWHMERAFESVPANGSIQQELCRLYGRRDGVVPAKARLTRGALARMYAQGGLYIQAEAELKAALAVDADRIDLMTKLAEVYWHTDQVAQAAQTSAAILQKLPYSLEANRILVDVFRAQSRPSDAALYRQRLEALDPYEAFADPGANGAGAARVEAAKVPVARLEYVPGMEDTGSPDWLASIGAKFEEPAGARAPETQPDWLSAAGEAAKALPAEDYQPGQGSVPDWLKDLDAGAGATAEAQSSGSPDWLQDLTTTTAPLANAPNKPDEGLPDWLMTATGPLPADAVPDWMLQGSSDTQAVDDAPGTAPLDFEAMAAGLPEFAAAPAQPPPDEPALPAPAAAEPPGELPDWLKANAADESEEDFPDWLKAITAQPLPSAEVPTGQATTIPVAQIPEWLKGAAPDDATLVPASTQSSGDVPGWLQTAASDQPGTGALPDWLQQATGTLDPAKAPELPRAEPAATANPPVAEAPSEPPAPPEAPVVAGPAMEAPQPAIAAEPTSLGALPDWLKTAAAAGETLLAAAPTQPVADSAAGPAQPAAAEQAGAEPAFEMPDWLKTVAPAEAGLDIEAEPLPTTAAAAETAAAPLADAELPDWLKSATAVPAQDETPVWLQTAPAGPSLVSARADDEPEAAIPDWLRSIAAGAPPADAPTAGTPTSGALPVELPDYLQRASPEAIARAEQPLEMEPEEEKPEEQEPAGALPAEIPDWLKALAPSPDPVASKSPPPVRAEASAGASLEDSLSWLDELTAGASLAGAAPAGEPSLEEPPPWLAAAATAAPEPATVAPGRAGEDTPAAEIPPWAQTEEPGPTDTIVGWLAGKHVPDWLRKPVPEAPSLPAVEWEPDSAKAPAEPAAMDSLPATAEQDDLAAPAGPTAQAEPAEAAAPRLDTMDPEAAFRWLESLAAQQGAKPEELFTSPVEAGPIAPPADSVAQAPAADAAPEPSRPAAELPAMAAEPPEPSQPAAELPAMAAEAPGPSQPAAELLAVAAEPPGPSQPAAELPAMAAEVPEPAAAGAETFAAETGGLEEFLRQAEVAMPVEHLADTAPAQLKPPVAEAPAAAGAATVAAAPEPETASAEAPAMTAQAEPAAASAEFDADAAMRWLEGLAAQQGAKPEELLTAPEERTLAAPSWVAAEQAAARQAQEPAPMAEQLAPPDETIAPIATTELAIAVDTPVAMATVAPAEAAAEPMLAPVEAAAEAVPEHVAQTLAPDADADAAMRWLEGLAAQQGANPEELLTAPAERTLEAPAWVAAQAAAAEPEPPAVARVEPAANAMPEPEPEPAEPEPEPAAAFETPEWLKALAEAEQPSPAATVEPVEAPAPAERAEAAEPAPTQAAADLDKLSRLAERLAAARRARELEMEARFAEQRTQQEAARRWVEGRLGSHGTGPLAAAASAAAEEPVVEPPSPAPVAAQAPAAEPGPPAPTPAPASRRHARPYIPVRRSRPMTPAISPAAAPAALAAPTAPAEALARGQAALSGQDYEAAVAHLSVLVEQGQHLDTVVQSLESAAGAGRAPVPVLRLLGDAYLRTEQLQKALDTYRQALSRL